MKKMLVFWSAFLAIVIVCLVGEIITGAGVWAYISSACMVVLGVIKIGTSISNNRRGQ